VPEIRRAIDHPLPPPATEPLMAEVDGMRASPTRAQAATATDAGRPRAGRMRLCVLCGEPLRAGQRLTRVQGSTIHMRCGNGGR
jgi:hypothetical protein